MMWEMSERGVEDAGLRSRLWVLEQMCNKVYFRTRSTSVIFFHACLFIESVNQTCQCVTAVPILIGKKSIGGSWNPFPPHTEAMLTP